MTRERSRRAFLVAGGASVGLTALAGCLGGGFQGSGTGTTDATTTDATTTDAGTITTTTQATRTVEDAAGRSVELPATVERVVGLGAGALRLIAYLGATDRVVGVEQLERSDRKRPYRPYDLANPALSSLPSVGSRKSPDPELLLQRDPDVVCWAWASAGTADDLQAKLDVPVVAVEPGVLDTSSRPSFFDALGLLGDVLGTTDRANELIQRTKSFVGDLAERTADVSDPPSAYVGYLGRGRHGFTYTQPSYPPLAFVGVDNVASDVTDNLKRKKGAPRAKIDPEQLIKWDPEYVFVDLGTESYDALGKSEYGSVTAIENDQVYGVLPTRDYAMNFGTVLADAYAVGTVLYPDRFGDDDPASKADDVYEAFVGARVYDTLVEAYGAGFGKMAIPS